MILTEEKTYIINVTEVDTDAELGLNKKDIMIEYTNLELLHAVLASTMPYGRLSARYRGKRKAELQSRIAMVESVLETRGDQLAKAEQIMYLDTAERSAICHYLGIIYTRLIAQKLYGTDCMVPLNLIEQPGEKKFVKYNGAYRQDLIGYGKQNAWSVWEPVGRSENSQAAFGNGCRAASEIEKINENPLAKSAACMTYYERGYLNAVIKEPERTGDGTLWFLEENYFKNGQTEISVLKIWLDCCTYYQLPRLLNQAVLERTIVDGVSKGDYFGYADGKDGEQYLGFQYGSQIFSLGFDDQALLIEKETAAHYKEEHMVKSQTISPATKETSVAPGINHTSMQQTSHGNPCEQKKQYKNFFASASIDPVKGTFQFQTIMQELVSLFTTKPGVKVAIKLDIEASSPIPFDDNTVRAVRENSIVLKLESSDFSED